MGGGMDERFARLHRIADQVAKERGWHGPIFYEVFFKSALCGYLETRCQFLLECLNARFGEPLPEGVAGVLAGGSHLK